MYEHSMAEAFYHYAYMDVVVKVCLAPDVELLLFLDGSAAYVSGRAIVLYESVWSTANI